MMKILIAGCGDVGSVLAERLVNNGHEVFGLRRHISKLPEDVKPVKADLTDYNSLKNIPRNLDMVFFTAAAPSHSEQDYQTCYVKGLQNLLTALKENGERPKRIFFTSSTSVYGNSDGAAVDEDSPTEPLHFSGKLMLEAEQVLLNSDFSGTAVRFGGIYGPGRTRLLDMAAQGHVVIKNPYRITNRIHRDDCASALIHLMGLDNPDSVYNAIDDTPSPYCEVLSWLALKMGNEEPKAINDERKDSRGSKRCLNHRLKGTGFVFKYPSYREGYGELLKDYCNPVGS